MVRFNVDKVRKGASFGLSALTGGALCIVPQGLGLGIIAFGKKIYDAAAQAKIEIAQQIPTPEFFDIQRAIAENDAVSRAASYVVGNYYDYSIISVMAMAMGALCVIGVTLKEIDFMKGLYRDFYPGRVLVLQEDRGPDYYDNLIKQEKLRLLRQVQ